MTAKGKQSFVLGAAILTVSMMIVKVIGMFYKIPLGNILGGSGMSYFMTAYSIFTPVYSLSVAGFPSAISKLVSENMAKRRYRDVRRVFLVSLALLLVLGLLSFVVLFFGAGWVSALIGNPDAPFAVAAMAPSLLFCCLMAALRGYYQGLGNMTPTALSQILEAGVKLVCGIGFAWYFLKWGLDQYAATGMVFGIPADSPGQAELLALPYAAAGALLGVSASALAGALYLFLRRLFGGDGITKRELAAAPPAAKSRSLLKGLVSIALPICLAAMLAHVTNLVDVATIMHRIGAAMEKDGGAVLNMYAGLTPPDMEPGALPSYLYGAYGYTTSIFNLVPSLTMALGISALPVIAGHWATGNRRQSAEQIKSVIKLTALLAVPAGLGIAALAQPILALLYPNRLEEVAIAAPILRSMGFAAVLTGITTPMSSVFQAIGKPTVPVKLMAVGAALKIGANYILIAIPRYNITAVPVGTILCYGFILLTGLAVLQRSLDMGTGLYAVLIKPLFCGIICGIAAYTSYGLLYRIFPSRLTCLLAVGVGGIFYLIFVLFLRVISRNEALMLPNGKKVAKILEKLSFLG